MIGWNVCLVITITILRWNPSLRFSEGLDQCGDAINLEDRVIPSGKGINIAEAWKFMEPGGTQYLKHPRSMSGDVSGEEIT
jgi:hypothetical protein